jgi:coenzyme F420 hydrogenase subunit beta
MKTIKDVVKSGLCVGCGLCAYSDAIGTTVFSSKRGQNIPLLSQRNYNDDLAFDICPGKGYQIIKDTQERFGESRYDTDLGHIYGKYAVCTNDKEILERASSGGIMSSAAIFLLENGIVDRVLTTYFVYDNDVRTVCRLASNRQEILESQGSKYCPVDLSEAVREIRNNNYRVAIIGTPCQIAGIRNIQKLDENFNRKIVITIGNFCGGIKQFGNINLLAKRKGVDPSGIKYFRFRGNGQPGSMMIRDKSGNTVEHNYPEYVGLTGISKHLRCHLCVDATAELADLACGDAWLPGFLKDSNPWSVVITRNRIADDLIREMERKSFISVKQITTDEIKISQKENLTSKKVRQKSRYYLYRMLGYKIPSFDGGYHDNRINILTEIKVFSKHRIRSLLEKIHLFSTVYKVLNPGK